MQKKWLILLIFGSFAGFCGFVFLVTAYYKLFKGDAYYQSVAAIQSHPEVIEALGSPIKPGWLFSGDHFFYALTMQYDIKGPNGQGRAYLDAIKIDDEWILRRVSVRAKNRDDFISVVQPPDPPEISALSGGSCNAPKDYDPDAPTEEAMDEMDLSSALQEE